MTTHTAHVHVEATPETVFEIATDYARVTEWATNFILRLEGDDKGGYTAQTPFGPARYEIRADAKNGVADQYLDGRPFPARVVPVPGGTLYTFTLMLPPELPPAEVERGIAGLEEELANLKRLSEAA